MMLTQSAYSQDIYKKNKRSNAGGSGVGRALGGGGGVVMCHQFKIAASCRAASVVDGL